MAADDASNSAFSNVGPGLGPDEIGASLDSIPQQSQEAVRAAAASGDPMAAGTVAWSEAAAARQAATQAFEGVAAKSTRTLYHGAPPSKIAGVMKSGGFIPKNGEVFLSETMADTFVHGTSRQYQASFVVEVEVEVEVEVALPSTGVVRTSTQGIPRTIRVEGGNLVTATVTRMFVRTRAADGTFSVDVIDGFDDIARYLAQLGVY
ncbi:MAG: hypothetical protein IPL61_22995 [Myxococcales bacterium]|nr:hypothetical protein [Myxococcales bacterium]